MYARTPTRLSLTQFAEVLGLNPYHFAGIAVDGSNGTPDLEKTVCDAVLFQHAWQSRQKVAREIVAEAIASAEAMIEREVGWPLVPSFLTNVEVRPQRPYPTRSFNNTWSDVRGDLHSVRLPHGYLISGGKRGLELIEADSPITWTDEDNDQLDETATVSFATEETDGCQFHVFYPGHDGDPRYEIRPVSVDVALGIAYVTFQRHQVVKPEILEKMVPQIAIASDVDDFLEEVDVYREYIDPSDQATLYWTSQGCLCGNSGSCSACQYGNQAACLQPVDPVSGWVSYVPGAWDEDEEEFRLATPASWTVPTFMRVNYYAGWQGQGLVCPRNEMDRDWARVVARFALAILDEPLCGCNRPDWEAMQADLSFQHGATDISVYQLTADDLGNPFGTRRGAIEAWRRVRRERHIIGRGVVLT